MHIYLIRHGETYSNINNTFGGHTDSHLTDKGIKQAMEVAQKLKEIEFDAVYVSDLSRALDTAMQIVGPNKHMIQTKQLREMNFGLFEDLTLEEILQKYPDEYKAWSEDYVNNVIPNGESMKLAHERAVKQFDGIVENTKPNETILIVTHSGVIRSILAQTLNQTLDAYWKYKIENCGVNILEFDGEFSFLTKLNG